MKVRPKTPACTHGKPFADRASSARALAFKSLQPISGVLFKAIKERRGAVAAFAADAGDMRDVGSSGTLLLKSADFGRVEGVRAVAFVQAMITIVQTTAVSLSELMQAPARAVDDASASGPAVPATSAVR